MKWRWILIGFGILLLVLGLGFWGYIYLNSHKAQESVQKTINETAVEVEKESGYIHIEPQKTSAADASPVIYYPGGLVEPKAYLGLLAQVAQKDKRDIYVATPPFNLSIFAIDRARNIIHKEDLNNPLVGGHSLGGVSACRFVKSNQDLRLFLFASYCDKDISQSDVAVVSVMGERDRIVDRENYQDAKSNLPSDADIQEVEKVNHADFGQYGYHEGDARSRVSEERMVSVISDAFQRLENMK